MQTPDLKYWTTPELSFCGNELRQSGTVKVRAEI